MEVVINMCINFSHVTAKDSSSLSLGRNEEINALLIDAKRKVLAQVSFSMSNLSNFTQKMSKSLSDSFTSLLNLGWFSTTLMTVVLAYGS